VGGLLGHLATPLPLLDTGTSIERKGGGGRMMVKRIGGNKQKKTRGREMDGTTRFRKVGKKQEEKKTEGETELVQKQSSCGEAEKEIKKGGAAESRESCCVCVSTWRTPGVHPAWQ